VDEETDGRAREEEKTMSRTLGIPYGTGGLRVDLPSSIEPVTLLPAVAAGEVNASDGEWGEAAVRKALREPMGSPTLGKLAAESESALVVIPDKTRAAGVREYLPPVLAALAEGGLDERSVRVLTANGAHPPMSEAELAELVGVDIYSRYRPSQHDSRDRARLSDVGVTSRGTAVAVNSACLETDLLVLTGAVSFHYFAGFGGGRKLLFPGLASYDSIVANHKLVLGPTPGIHPSCRSGRLEGNPVHEDIMEAFRMLPAPFVLTTVVAPRGPVLQAFAGAHDDVFKSACGAAERAFGIKIDRKADLVIASCGGHPWDINLLQMHKSLRHAAAVVRDGGVLVLAGQAPEGIGSQTLEQGLRYGTWKDVDRAMRQSYILNGHTAVSLLKEAERLSLHLVSSLGQRMTGAGWADFYEDAQAAVEAALHGLGVKHPLVYFMPLAAMTVPQP
jgi:nickel-dependent lactate racemase